MLRVGAGHVSGHPPPQRPLPPDARPAHPPGQPRHASTRSQGAAHLHQEGTGI